MSVVLAFFVISRFYSTYLFQYSSVLFSGGVIIDVELSSFSPFLTKTELRRRRNWQPIERIETIGEIGVTECAYLYCSEVSTMSRSVFI